MKIGKGIASIILSSGLLSSSCDFMGGYDYLKGEHQWTFDDALAIYQNAKESYNLMANSIDSLQTSLALYIASLQTSQDSQDTE